MVNGEANLYYYKGDNLDRYFIQNVNDSLLELINTIDEIDKYKFHEKKEYVGILKNVLSDCPEMINEIDNTKHNQRELIKLTESYHDYVCKEYECINYKKLIKPIVSFDCDISIESISFPVCIR